MPLQRLNERGIALGVVVVMAMVFAVGAFGTMMLSTSRGQVSGLQAHRLKAQYAAEAGLVTAMQKLWGNPEWSSPAGDVDLSVNGLDVDIILPGCAETPCENRALKATVLYPSS